MDKRSLWNLRRANVAQKFIPQWKRNALWELVNMTQKIIRLWFRGMRNLSCVAVVVVCRIREESLNSAFKQCHTIMKGAHHYDTCEKQLEDMRFNQRMCKQKKRTAQVIYF